MRRIRSSMLPSVGDCERRAVVKQYPDLVEGYEPRKLLHPAGGLIGTATHSMSAQFARNLLNGTNVDPVEAAVEDLKAEAAEGVEWDDTTKNIDTAIKQSVRLFESYLPVLSTRRPKLVEAEMLGGLNDRWELSGTIDLLTVDGRVDDLKTGSKLSAYIAQLGAYAILTNAHIRSGAIKDLPAVTAVSTTFVKRVPLSAVQPSPVTQEYEVDAAQRLAMSAIKTVMRDVDAFEVSRDPNVFTANPMSMVCNEKYCPVWGTEFCKAHLPKVGE